MRVRPLNSKTLLAALLATLLGTAALATPADAVSTRTRAQASTVRVAAPALASSSTPGDNGRKVFAHYFPPYPVSLDHKPAANDYYTNNYLNINGENGKWAAYGGLLRDRPSTHTAASDDWQVADLRTEVRQAKAAGIDGFTLNIMSTSGINWTASVNLMRAAQEVGGFEVVPNIDVTAGVGAQAPTALAAKLAQLYAYPSAARMGTDYLLSSFAAEYKPVSWWDQLATSLRTTYHVPTKFIAVFLDATAANMRAFAPISYGFGNWGLRTVDSVNATPDYVARAHALGKKWMQPVAFQDSRPLNATYAEAANTGTGRAAWSKAIRDGADFVQMVTWNDYSESTQIAPSRAHGSVLLSISKYYIHWLKTGHRAPITTDHLYVTHRRHPWAATPYAGQRSYSSHLGGMVTPPRDTVEALLFLTSPARVTVRSGSESRTFSVPAGMSTATIPLRPGKVSAVLTRGATVVRSVTSPFTVTQTPRVLDYEYFAVGR